MTNDELFQQPTLYLAITEDKQTVPVVPLGDDFYYSMDFLRQHAAENMDHGSAETPLWQAGFVSDNAQALRIYYQIPNVPDDVSAWGQTLYKVGNYYVYKVFDANKKVVYRKLEHDVGISPFFMIALSIATAGAASALGAAVVGAEAAAAYPALATLVGQVAINTAINGGDVEGAVKSAIIGQVAGYAGQYVGAGVTNLTNAELAGKVAANITSSAIKGGNVLIGAFSPVLSAGADYISDAFTGSAGTAPPVVSLPNGGNMDDFFGDASYGFDDPGTYFSDGSTALDLTGGDTPPIYTFGGFDDPVYQPFTSDGLSTGIDTGIDMGSGQGWDPSGGDASLPSVDLPDPSIFLPDYQVQGGANVPTTQGGTDWGSALAKLGTIALQVYTQQHNPNIKAVTSSVRLPDGSVQTVNRNGTVTTTSPTGQTTTTQLPPGQPYRFPDGSIVMNNGNGSYTRQSQTGQISTAQYGSLFSGGVSAPLLLGGAALLLFALRK